MEAGTPQGSPVSTIMFAMYTSGLMKWVAERVAGGESLYCVDKVGRVATTNDVNQVINNLEASARMSIDRAERRELKFYTAKNEGEL